MTIGEILKSSTLEQEILLATILKKDRSFLSAFPEKKLTTEQLTKFNALARRLEKNEPLAYLLGYQEFYGRNFLVNKNVLIPRADTEILIEETLIIVGQRELNLVDVGTGSGCIAITLALANPKLNIVATEIDTKALSVAKKNAKLYGVERKIKFIKSNLLEKVSAPIDIIVANLPYIPTKSWEKLPKNIKDFEPRVALDSGKNKVALYERLFSEARSKLNKGGLILYEIDGQVFRKEI